MTQTAIISVRIVSSGITTSGLSFSGINSMGGPTFGITNGGATQGRMLHLAEHLNYDSVYILAMDYYWFIPGLVQVTVNFWGLRRLYRTPPTVYQ